MRVIAKKKMEITRLTSMWSELHLMNLGLLSIPLPPIPALLIAPLLQMSTSYCEGHQVQKI